MFGVQVPALVLVVNSCTSVMLSVCTCNWWCEVIHTSSCNVQVVMHVLVLIVRLLVIVVLLSYM